MDCLGSSFDRNIENLSRLLRIDKNFDIIYKPMQIDSVDAGFFFIDGFVDDGIMQRILQFFYGLKQKDLTDADAFMKASVPYVEVDISDRLQEIVTAVLSGMLAFLYQGSSKAILIDVRTYPARSVDEPWKDKVLRGSRDGFVETLVFNVALMRRRIRDPYFSVEIFQVGQRSKSDVAVCYIEDKADKKLLEQIKTRISSIEVEALTMNIESLSEALFQGKMLNPFPKFKYSERPDTAAASVYDGNIVIMVDNSPAVMIIPTSVFDLMEEADEFYFPPSIGTYLRLSKFFTAIITVVLLPLWVLYLRNPSMVPAGLEFILDTGESHMSVLGQILILEFAIDGLRLAAINTPSALSTPLSVVAGIVLGESAVQSGWFCSQSLLYMAAISIATYTQPSFEMGYALKFVRILTVILTWFLGLWGLVAGFVIGLVLLCTNRTISGKSYIYPLIPFNASKLKRKIFREKLNAGMKKAEMRKS